MEKYVWLFPLLFIFHDMEEIVGFKIWLIKNKEEIVNKFPKTRKIYDNYSTEGMALAVFEELTLCIIFCIMSIITNWYALWLGGFIAYSIHLVIHIIQCIVIRKYIPAVATSIICLPISIYFISSSIKVLEYGLNYVLLFSFIGIVIVSINLRFSHIIMRRFTKFMEL